MELSIGPAFVFLGTNTNRTESKGYTRRKVGFCYVQLTENVMAMICHKIIRREKGVKCLANNNGLIHGKKYIK